jgi:GAF domain-containing protein
MTVGGGGDRGAEIHVASPVFQALVDTVAEGTDALVAWMVARDGGRLRVVAAVGEATHGLIGQSVGEGDGIAGYVVASGQPLALTGSSRDPRLAEGVASLIGRRPGTVLCVPCLGAESVVGAIEAVDKRGSGAFTFDDVELAGLLARIGGAALADTSNDRAVRSPAELARDLERLAAAEPARYAVVAEVLESLLSYG